MSAPIDILNELRARGVELHADGDRLRFRPAARVTPDLLSRLREHKPALLAFLKGDPRSAPGVKPAGRKAERLGVSGQSAGDFRQEPQWVTGESLALLPEPLQGLVCPRDGWAPRNWSDYLRYKARCCAQLDPELAERYRNATQMILGGGDGP